MQKKKTDNLKTEHLKLDGGTEMFLKIKKAYVNYGHHQVNQLHIMEVKEKGERKWQMAYLKKQQLKTP